MNLVDCPECGKSISQIAVSCPNCGFPASLFFGFKGSMDDSSEADSYLCVALNPETPQNLLRVLSQSDEWTIRRGVAQNPSAPASILAALSRDGDEDVRASVAGNGNAPISVLEHLAGDADAKLLEAVIGNPGAPEYVRAAAEESYATSTADDGEECYECEDDDWWYDDPADHDPRELSEGYYHSRSGDFYVNAFGEKCDVQEYDGYRIYFDEDNGWLEC